MNRYSYRERDYSFGQTMLDLRSALGLTQAGLAEILEISRQSIIGWEMGSKYPKSAHLKSLIDLALKRGAFSAGHEEEEIRMLWQEAHQKMRLNETWLTALLASQHGKVSADSGSMPASPAESEHHVRGKRKNEFNLPFQPTSLVGRTTELATINNILRDRACHLLTLVGPGGIGKTRLALEVAARQADAFAEGVVFVPLGSVSATYQIISTIGEALNLTFTGQSDPTADLFNYLHERQMLLVLDNFEHLLDGADVVYDLMHHAPDVTFLITSQMRLGLQAEWLFDVQGLAYPTDDKQGVISSQSSLDLTKYDAVQLFLQRVRQVQPEFAVSESTLVTIGQICSQVVGIPLAIELAAASVRTQSVEVIHQEIRVNLDALSTSLRDVPPRQRSLRAVFNYSWNLLNEPERVLLSRLAVFHGGCSAEASEQVVGPTLPALMGLVDKSLLQRADVSIASNAGDNVKEQIIEDRFSFLPPIQEYALEKLVASGEAQIFQHAHATYYRALAEAAAADWETLTSDTATKLLERENDNIRAALQWTLNGGDLTTGLQLGVALGKFWRRRGDFAEGRAWLDALLALDDTSSDSVVMLARFRALHMAAWMASDQYAYAHAKQLYEQSIPLGKALGETNVEIQLLSTAARQARAAGQYQQATMLFEAAVSHYRAIGDRSSMSSNGLGFSLYELAIVVREQGDFERATVLIEESIELHRVLGDREGIANGLLGFGDVARDQGDVIRVRQFCTESLTMSRDLGLQSSIGFSLNNLALAAYREGDLAKALMLIGESISLFRGQSAKGGLAEILVTMGYILQAQGKAAAALDTLTEALRYAWESGPRLIAAMALEGVADVLAQHGESLAVQLLSAASVMRVQMGTPVRPADRPNLERALNDARLRLGNDTFDTLWSRAREQSVQVLLSTIPKASLSNTSDPFPPVLPATQSSIRLDDAFQGTVSNQQGMDWGDADRTLE